MRKTFQVADRLTDEDINWIAQSKLDVEIERPYTKSFDTGWCDYGQRFEVITKNHVVKLTVKSEKEEVWLRLYWGDRAFELNTYLVQTLAFELNTFLGDI